jgi:MFS family permease
VKTIRLARSFPAAVQLLLVNTFGIALGFYLLFPYLATYLRDHLHLAAAVVGAVLGLRVLCQQGLTLVGGTLADRIGVRPMIIAGCALRTVAFAMFAVFDNVAGLVAASMLVGFAGAIFSPASRAYLAIAAGEKRLDAFALQNVAMTVGALAGPLIGSVLVAFDFRLTAAGAASVFGVLTVWQVFKLPAHPVAKDTGSTLASWKEVLSNKGFVAFAIATSVLFLFYNQFYLSLPLEATRVTGWIGATTGVFLASTIVTLLAQVRLVRWLNRRVAPGIAVTAGLAIVAASFVPLALSMAFIGDDVSLWAAIPVALAAIALTLGLDIAQPFAQELVVGFARPALTGTYIGMFGTASGIATALGNTGVGAVDDLGRGISLPWLSAAGLSVLAFATAAAVYVMHRRGTLPRPPESAQDRESASGEVEHGEVVVRGPGLSGSPGNAGDPTGLPVDEAEPAATRNS